MGREEGDLSSVVEEEVVMEGDLKADVVVVIKWLVVGGNK